ncbi:thyrotropin-releasing hormone receptor-like [Lingula anatina]|uniref:Thyrotropin-releasing hormone receptor-like n=1 Tax=Lingula anatina TaxID=7574 RepID=A0A1S3JM55_LINAN|nr:thyrotropin-releasing hormone receptor-like [Lingula anatina]|eukprot:XP_013411468.1 thyrotropin-releasing hormone receptor-like [Lingula anatina]
MSLTNVSTLNNVCKCPNVTGNCSSDLYDRMKWVEIVQDFAPAAFYADRIVTPIWYVIGCLGNVTSLIIWSNRRMRKNNTSAYYLCCLALSDLCFLVLHLLMELKIAWGLRTIDYQVVCEIFMVLYYTPQYLSPLLILGFTGERFMAVCYPLKAVVYCTKKITLRLIFIMSSLAFALCSVQAYLWKYDAISEECIFRPEAFVGSMAFGTCWTWGTEILGFAVVPVVVIGLNLAVIASIWGSPFAGKSSSHESIAMQEIVNHKNVQKGKASRSKTKTTSTLMLLSVSFFAIGMTLPATIVYAVSNFIAEGDPCLSDSHVRTDSTWKMYFGYITARKLIEEICLSHYACNFFIYICGTKFRKAFRNFCHRKAFSSDFNRFSKKRESSSTDTFVAKSTLHRVTKHPYN